MQPVTDVDVCRLFLLFLLTFACGVPVLYRLCTAYKISAPGFIQRSGDCGPLPHFLCIFRLCDDLQACHAAAVFLTSSFNVLLIIVTISRPPHRHRVIAIAFDPSSSSPSPPLSRHYPVYRPITTAIVSSRQHLKSLASFSVDTPASSLLPVSSSCAFSVVRDRDLSHSLIKTLTLFARPHGSCSPHDESHSLDGFRNHRSYRRSSTLPCQYRRDPLSRTR